MSGLHGEITEIPQLCSELWSDGFQKCAKAACVVVSIWNIKRISTIEEERKSQADKWFNHINMESTERKQRFVPFQASQEVRANGLETPP